jgi:hypothetical protein
MSAHLRRVIDLGPNGTIYPGSAQDYRFHDNRRWFEDTGTSWVRLWADWPSLQPDPAFAPDDPAGAGLARLDALDAQIAAANADGVRVILMPFRFPSWANGTEALAAARNTDAEAAHGFADRMTASVWQRYVEAGRDPRRYNPYRRTLEFLLPTDTGPESPWGGFLAFLYDRYHLGRAADGRPYAHAFEVVNEPNIQVWPQRGPSPTDDPFALGELTVPHVVAGMLATAQAVSARHGHSSLVLAPSCADSLTGSRLVTLVEEFTPALLDALDAIGHVAHPGEIWAHHNYSDLEARLEVGRVQAVRASLRGRWSGLAEAGEPVVWITEGGVRLEKMRAMYPEEEPFAAQARSLREGWERHVRDDGAGAGIGMFAQYLTYADPRFDTGLLDPWPAVVKRPVYDVWAALPRFE